MTKGQTSSNGINLFYQRNKILIDIIKYWYHRIRKKQRRISHIVDTSCRIPKIGRLTLWQNLDQRLLWVKSKGYMGQLQRLYGSTTMVIWVNYKGYYGSTTKDIIGQLQRLLWVNSKGYYGSTPKVIDQLHGQYRSTLKVIIGQLQRLLSVNSKGYNRLTYGFVGKRKVARVIRMGS